jgi:ketosteroid isomerase-like protein
MSRKIFAAILAAFALAAASSAQAQNTNSTKTTTRTTTPRTTTPRTAPTPNAGGTQTPASSQEAAPRTRTRRAAASTAATGGQTRASVSEPGAAAVRAVFDTLIKNIERADVDAVMALYWSSPQLAIFNNNGTVTRGWEQVRSNRASSYPDAKNVKIDVRDVKVQMLGTGGAIVTCLWRQSQEFRGATESSSGRLTVVYRLINNGWKIVHTHSSPDAPDPSRLAPSEQTAPPARPVATPPPSS